VNKDVELFFQNAHYGTHLGMVNEQITPGLRLVGNGTKLHLRANHMF
jgi:hypothetical protein